jgi:hypothetical protein
VLGPERHASQLQRWYARLETLTTQAREQLQGDPSALATRLIARSGCTPAPDGTLRLAFQGQEYALRLPEFDIRQIHTDERPTSFVQALILTYLITADGTPPSERWIAYHDLPGGMFYARAFRGYAENRLARELDLAGFRAGAERLGGDPIGIGSAGYAFPVLPRVRLAAVYWEGDEDLEAEPLGRAGAQGSQASVLFQDTASHYMTTDGLAVLGSHLVGDLIYVARRGSLAGGKGSAPCPP